MENEVRKMKIMGNIGSVYQTYKIDKKDKIEQKGLSEFEKVKNGIADKVEISNNAKSESVNNSEVEFIKRRYFTVQGKREEKIAKLKEDVKNGRYSVSDEDIADAIIGSESEETV